MTPIGVIFRSAFTPGPNNFDGNPVICLGFDVRKLLLQIGGEVVSAALVIGPAEAVRLSLLEPR